LAIFKKTWIYFRKWCYYNRICPSFRLLIRYSICLLFLSWRRSAFYRLHILEKIRWKLKLEIKIEIGNTYAKFLRIC